MIVIEDLQDRLWGWVIGLMSMAAWPGDASLKLARVEKFVKHLNNMVPVYLGRLLCRSAIFRHNIIVSIRSV